MRCNLSVILLINTSTTLRRHKARAFIWGGEQAIGIGQGRADSFGCDYDLVSVSEFFCVAASRLARNF
jgi:hypothetical protein